jgi:hypothetical protein
MTSSVSARRSCMPMSAVARASSIQATIILCACLSTSMSSMGRRRSFQRFMNAPENTSCSRLLRITADIFRPSGGG